MDEELHTLLSIFAVEVIQQELDSATGKDEVSAKIAAILADVNIHHNIKQVSEYLTKLEQDYNLIRTTTTRVSFNTMTLRWPLYYSKY